MSSCCPPPAPKGYGHYHQTGQPYHPAPCPATVDNCIVYNESAQGRPITWGLFQAVRPNTGAAIPYARVWVVYSGTANPAPIYSHPSKNGWALLPNPVTANEFGRTPLYFSGGPVDVHVFEQDGTTLVEQFTNYGGFQDTDWPNGDIPCPECIKVESPGIKIYDKVNCNLPASFASPKHIYIAGAVAMGIPAGKYQDIVDYFDCRGESIPDGVVVYGDSVTTIFRYDATACNGGFPPNPENGPSVCWVQLIPEP